MSKSAPNGQFLAKISSQKSITPYGPLPSASQLAYHRDELAAFIHFGMNTFYNQEWGNGQEDPRLFNPKDLDAHQWVKLLKEVGFKRLILVVKHHDGFVLYPSAQTDYTLAASPFRDGQGDLLAEVSEAASFYDMDMGIYLSPWDAHSPLYHKDTSEAYNRYYKNQLIEILSNPRYGNKGKFVEIWMDGARGEGAQKVDYDFEAWFETIRELQGDIVIFSNQATSLRWIGNESGYAGDPLWQKVQPQMMGEETERDYLNHGDPAGTVYSIGEVDVSLRPGWFYHEHEYPKSVEELLEIYFASVGRGTPILLNVSPNQAGLIPEEDEQVLRRFGAFLREFQGENLASQARVIATSYFSEIYLPQNVLLADEEKAWAPTEDDLQPVLEITFADAVELDVIELREAIALGQRIAQFAVFVEQEGIWQEFARGYTVGYRRLIRGNRVRTRKIRIEIQDSQALPVLSGIATYCLPKSVLPKQTSHQYFDQAEYRVQAGQQLEFSVCRTSEDEDLQLVLSPGTGVYGQAYRDMQVTLDFSENQLLSHNQLQTLPVTSERDFYLRLESQGQLLQLAKVVLVID